MTIKLRLLHCVSSRRTPRARAGSYAIRVGQPTLSRNIQEIERRIETQLFRRGTGGVVPTDAGEIFMEHAREVVARAADLNREMELLGGLEKGELKIGAGAYDSAMMVDRAVIGLLRAYPAIRLQIHTDNREKLLPLLRKRELDLAVIGLGEIKVEPEMHIARLIDIRATSSFERTSISRVKRGTHSPEHPAVSWGSDRAGYHSCLEAISRQQVGRQGESAQAKSFPAIACESVAMMKMIVAETEAVGLLPLNTVMAEVQDGQLVVLSLVPPFLKVELGIVRLAHRRLSPLGETFVRLQLDVDAEVLKFEEDNAPKVIAAPNRTRSRVRSAVSA